MPDQSFLDSEEDSSEPLGVSWVEKWFEKAGFRPEFFAQNSGALVPFPF
jgi:hypothetical protein